MLLAWKRLETTLSFKWSKKPLKKKKKGGGGGYRASLSGVGALLNDTVWSRRARGVGAGKPQQWTAVGGTLDSWISKV